MGYGLFFALSPLQAQTAIKKFSLELKNESLPEALKQLEKAGGKTSSSPTTEQKVIG